MWGDGSSNRGTALAGDPRHDDRQTIIKKAKNREIAVAGYFVGEDRIENEESESDYQSGLKQYNV